MSPAEPGTLVSIASTTSAIVADEPPRLKTRAPSISLRAAISSVRPMSPVYWKTVRPLNPISNGRPRSAATTALVGELVSPWSRPGPNTTSGRTPTLRRPASRQ